MPVEMRMWRIDGDRPRPLRTAVLPTEAALEDFLEQDPSLLGTPLLVVGRQVRTPHREISSTCSPSMPKGICTSLNSSATKTPRDVVAQVLDYGSWVATLTREQVIDLASGHLKVPVEAAFEDVFGTAPPDELKHRARAHHRGHGSGRSVRARRDPRCRVDPVD